MLRRSSGRSQEVVACENRTKGVSFFFFLFQEEVRTQLRDRVARNFCGFFFLRIGNFLCFAGTYFSD